MWDGVGADGVKMTYANCSTIIIGNGELTDNIYVCSSVRQGCPLSPLLFAVYIEPLCVSITQNENMIGYSLQLRSKFSLMPITLLFFVRTKRASLRQQL